MAMTAAVKDELARVVVTPQQTRKSEVAAMLRFAGGLHLVAGRVVVEAELDTGVAARRLRTNITQLYGHTSELAVMSAGGIRRQTTYLVRVAKPELAVQTGLVDAKGRPVRGLPPKIVNGTLDDAAGEAFDKVGRLLGLPYPGGPHVDRLSQEGDRSAIRFPRGLAAGKDKERHRYDFSFSGLKTAVARYVESLEDAGQEVPGADVCAAFSEAVNDSLTAKAVQACLDTGCDTLVVGGGYSANSRLRSLAAERCEDAGITLRLPPLRFCTDNGAQIAALGSAAVRAGVAPSPMDFAPDSGMPLDVSVAR